MVTTVSPGDRVRLVETTDPYSVLRPGDQGTVERIDALGNLHVRWDRGSMLGLVGKEDDWDLV